MMKLNKFIVSGLEQGKLKELLLGEGKWFIADNTFKNNHDIMLVMFVLLNWIKTLSDPQSMIELFIETLSEMPISHPRNCIDILLAYAITARDNSVALSFDAMPVLEELRANFRNNSTEYRNAEKMLIELEKRLQEVKIDAD